MPFEPDKPAEQFVPDGPALSPMQRRMGVGHQRGKPGETMNSMLEAIGSAGYDAGGLATDVAAKALPPEGAAAVGVGANMLVEGLPSLVGGAVGTVAKAPAAAEKLMQSALKPILSQIQSGKAGRAIQTMLDEGIPATKGGVAMLKDRINELELEVTQRIAAATGSVDKLEVLSHIKDTLNRFRNQVNPNADLSTIRASAKEFFDHPLLRGKDAMSVQTAQDLKEGTYRALGDKAYGMGLKPASERDAQKALALGLREGIEQAVPEVAAPNAKQSELINALKVLSRRTGIDANKNPVGLGWLAPHDLTMLAWLADRSPGAKSALAHGLYSGNLGTGTGLTAGTIYGASTGLPPDSGLSLAEIYRNASQ